MIVLTRLSPSAAAYLERSLAPEHAVRHTASWDEFVTALKSREADVMVFDPGLEPLSLGDMARLLGCGVPALAYLDLTARSVRATMELALFGVHRIVIRGHEDEPRLLRRAVEAAVAADYGERLLAGLGGRGVSLPDRLWRALRLLLRHPDRFTSVDALAAAAGLTRRSLDRWLMRAGLATAGVIIASARAMAAYRALWESTDPLCVVARRLGHSSPRGLARRIAVVTDLPPSVLRHTLTPDRFLERVATVLTVRRRGRATRRSRGGSGKRAAARSRRRGRGGAG